MRLRPALPALTLAVVLSGCATARMELPGELASVQPQTVTGANPRTWNHPLSFGPWHTVSVRERSTFSWGFEALGIGVTTTRRPYQLDLEGPAGQVREVACLTRDLTLSRGALSADLTGLVSPLLACSLETPGSGAPTSLVLGRTATRIRGVLQTPSAAYTVDSLHRIEGGRVPNGEPVGYALSRNGSTLAAVEVMNRGRVWISPAAPADDQAALAAASAALLLFDPEIGPDS